MNVPGGNAASSREGALHGLRVVDLSPTQLGAQVTQTLADFGADVVWVEPPEGAALRSLPSFPFLARGKRQITVDLKSQAGLDRVRSLIREADVVVETFRPGVADRLGIGYEALSAENHRLVYASVTGFGRHGPWSHLKGYEGVVGSVVGLNKSFDRMVGGAHPPFVTVPWGTFSASQVALHGILAALYEREQSGLGQWVEANMAQSLTTLDPWMWFLYLVAKRWPGAYTAVPAMSEQSTPNSYMTLTLLTAQTKDGRWLQFAQNSPRLFEALLKVMGYGDLLTDPYWEGLPYLEDQERRTKLWRMMLAAVKERTLAEWQAIFAADPNVFAELYRTGGEVLDHPQLVETGLVTEIVDPDRGPVRQPGPLVTMTVSPAVVARSVPPSPSVGSDVEWSSDDRGPNGRSAGGAAAGAPQASNMPLEGVTVLELAVLYAAPLAATLLTDLGARVIKIEQLDGDPTRAMAGFPEAGSAKPTQGKECIAVDIGTPEGRDIVHRLAARADLVLEGFRDGVAERLQVDAATLRDINPDLVYVSAHGYGVGGPLGDRPAFAPSIGAAGGIGAVNLGDSPVLAPCDSIADIGANSFKVGGSVTSKYATADGIAALGAATGLLLGLVARARGVGGQHITTSMLHTVSHALADHVVGFGGNEAPPSGASLRGPSALYRIYDAADGWVFLAVCHEDEWDAFAAVMAPHVDLRTDSRFAGQADRDKHDDPLAEILEDVFAKRAAAVWHDELTAVDVACVAVHTSDLEDLFMSDEYGRAVGYTVDVEHPTFGDHPRLAPAVAFSRSQTQAKPGRLCGADTRAVLGELGYTDAQTADLLDRKVIGVS